MLFVRSELSFLDDAKLFEPLELFFGALLSSEVKYKMSQTCLERGRHGVGNVIALSFFLDPFFTI